MNETRSFLDKELLLKLEKLAIVAKGKIKGTMQGQRRSKLMGTSLEFADFRLYSPGDDFRQLDWNAYGRTGKPFIKLFMDEQELQIHLYVDASKSMDFGADDIGSHGSKFTYAKQLAAAIGYIALLGYDRVSACFYSNEVHERLPLLRGRGSAQRLFRFLAEGESRGLGNMDEAIMRPLAIPRQRGITWLFSDFFYEGGVQEAITYLRAAGQEVVVIQVLSPQEVNPSLSGDLRLVDSELETGLEVAMSSSVLKAYQTALEQHIRSLQRFCYEKDIAYVSTTTDKSVTDTIFRLFRSSGIVF